MTKHTEHFPPTNSKIKKKASTQKSKRWRRQRIKCTKRETRNVIYSQKKEKCQCTNSERERSWKTTTACEIYSCWNTDEVMSDYLFLLLSAASRLLSHTPTIPPQLKKAAGSGYTDKSRQAFFMYIVRSVCCVCTYINIFFRTNQRFDKLPIWASSIRALAAILWRPVFRYSLAGTGFIIIFLLRLLTAVAAAAAVLIK